MKDIQTRNPVDIIHANYWLSGIVGHKLKHELNIPLVTTFHTLGETKKKSGFPETSERLLAESEIIGCSDVVVANSENEREQLHELYSANVDRIKIVPLGVEQAFFSPGNQHAAKAALNLPDGPILLFIGRLQSLKGVDVAIATLQAMKHEHVTLVVVGGASGIEGSSYETEIHNMADELQPNKKVLFVPPQPHHILSSYYRAANFVLVPSRSESFGLVALEAAACGVPAIASAVGGLENLVEHGKTGILIKGWNPTDFSQTIDHLLSNPIKSTEIAMNAVEKAKNYTWGKTAEKLLEIYQTVLSKSLVECR
jgi:D-inositol-3-phosphate glycosyltransferase